MTERKHTKFQTCERHRWLDRESRRRRAEFFVEGGPAGEAGCKGGVCRLWPGLDLFEPSVCNAEMPLDWTKASGPSERLEYLRGELRAERVSYEDLAELQSLAEHIDPSDLELREAAGVPEFDEAEA